MEGILSGPRRGDPLIAVTPGIRIVTKKGIVGDADLLDAAIVRFRAHEGGHAGPGPGDRAVNTFDSPASFSSNAVLVVFLHSTRHRTLSPRKTVGAR
jgi:hypothetical protein